MYWQRKVERSGVSMTLNNVYKLLLPYQGNLGSLMLHISGGEVSPLGSTGGAWRILDYISLIQVVVNGSTVVKSITGKEAQALAFFDQGVVPPGKWRNYASNTQMESFLINFGRWLKDDAMGLDLSAYSSCELWVTNTATSSQFSDLSITVNAFYLQDAPAHAWPAYMRTEEWNVWTTIADQWVYNNLPTERLIRRVMLQAIPVLDTNNDSKTAPTNLMDEIKFSLDTGNITVMDEGLFTLIRENFMDDGKLPVTYGWPYIPSGKGLIHDIGEPLVTVMGGGTQAATVATVVPTIESADSAPSTLIYGYQADHPNSFVSIGLAPFEAALIKCAEYDDPTTFLDPKARATVKLDIHTRNLAAAADGRNAIVLDRLVPQGL